MCNVTIGMPLVAYGLLGLAFKRQRDAAGLSEALAKAHLVVCLFIAVTTEILSMFHAISFAGLLVAWTLFLLACGALLLRVRPLTRREPLFVVPRGLSPGSKMIVGGVLLILLTTLATAILYPPTNFDSMTYHMSRVAHWMHNHEVAFFATPISRENYQMPFAEFSILHAQILTGSDRFASLVQWLSYLVLIGSSLLIAGELGLDKRQQLISATVMATLPMAILQASSTQNDLVVSGFISTFALFMLRLRRKLSFENMAFAAMSMGLALLSKGTAFMYCAMIGTSLAVPVLLKYRSDHRMFFKAASALAIIVLAALALNAGHLSRNTRAYGHPLAAGSSDYGSLKNEEHSAAAMLANVARNGALHLGTPYTLINAYTSRIMRLVFGSQLENPRTTWKNTSFVVPYSRHEDIAGNLIHMILILVSALVLPALWRRGQHTSAIWYAAGIILGTLLYCWTLKWQPWASRLHTPLFALAAPLIAITLTSGMRTLRESFRNALLVCMIVYGSSFALANSSRSLVSLDWKHKDRTELYFTNQKHLFRDYNSAVHVLQDAGAQDVGLYIGHNDWEYPLWALAPQTKSGEEAIGFRHVGATSVSGHIVQDESLPLHVLATIPLETWEHASEYAPIFESQYIRIFEKANVH